jgi:ATP-binding cassette subfamily F protein uup
VVSHDRVFLDNVVTSVFVFEGEGVVNEYVGGYTDWLNYSLAKKKEQATADKKEAKAAIQKSVLATIKAKKRSYKEQKELDELPLIIEGLEEKQTAITAKMNATNFYQQEQDSINTTLAELTEVGKNLEGVYSRWDELEAMAE